MARPIDVQIVRHARHILADADQWTRWAYARTREGVVVRSSDPVAWRYCAVGAVMHAARRVCGPEMGSTIGIRICQKLEQFGGLSWGGLEWFNDSKRAGRGQQGVLALFDGYMRARARGELDFCSAKPATRGWVRLREMAAALRGKASIGRNAEQPCIPDALQTSGWPNSLRVTCPNSAGLSLTAKHAPGPQG